MQAGRQGKFARFVSYWLEICCEVAFYWSNFIIYTLKLFRILVKIIIIIIIYIEVVQKRIAASVSSMVKSS